MRKDFGRVVIERARSGSSCPNLKMRKTGRLRLDAADWNEWGYDGPLKIRTNGIGGIKKAYDRKLAAKGFTDVLGPIHGYFRNSIGRRWDDIYSELTATLGGGGHAIRHVLTSHALGEVETATYVEDGKVYAQPRQPFRAYGPYFVDPRDGTLREEKKVSYKYRPLVLDRHYWKDGLWFVRVKGIWFLGSYTRNRLLADCQSRVGGIDVGSLYPYPLARSRHSSDEEKRDRLWPNVSPTSRDVWYFVKWKQANKADLKELRRMLSEDSVQGVPKRV